VGDQETNKEITRASSYFELDTKFSDSAECIEKILAEYYGNFSGSTTGATLNDDPTVKVKEELANLNMAVKEILGTPTLPLSLSLRPVPFLFVTSLFLTLARSLPPTNRRSEQGARNAEIQK
jgi:hypothetical protein